MRASPHTVLKDTLRLEKLLGQGAMGEVWEATHLTLGTTVAVKILHPGVASAEEVRARFAQEARVVAQIDSPHVVRVTDYGTTPDGDPFLVMERLSGGDLGARIAAAGRLSMTETADVIRQTCAGLASAHALGVVHRDVKPANVFLHATQGGARVKVLDFGVAKVVSPGALSLTRTEALVGTPYYMSPEQLVDSRAIDHRSDLWAVAVMAYECLTGRRPFAGESIGALTLAMHNTRPPKASSLRPDLPAGIDAWFDRALAVAPAHRFQTATELAEAFVAAMMTSTLPVGATRPQSMAPSSAIPSVPSGGSVMLVPLASTVRSAAPPADRRGVAPAVVVGLVAIAAIAVAGVAGGMFYLQRRQAVVDFGAGPRPQLDYADQDAPADPKERRDRSVPTADTSATATATAHVNVDRVPPREKDGVFGGGTSTPVSGGTIEDPSLRNVVMTCWRSVGAMESKGVPSAMTLTIVMQDQGAGAKRTTVGGAASVFPAFKRCVQEGASSTANRWGANRRGKTVTFSAGLPGCPFVPMNGTYVCPGP